MAYEKDLKDEIYELNSLRSLVEAYEEIASVRMKKTRDTVLKNRQFVNEINNIFEEVRSSFAKEYNALLRKKALLGKKGKTGDKVTLLSHNGKTVSVFLSANTGLYGDIVKKTFDLFIEEVRNSDSEVTIVGRQGLTLLNAEEPDRPYTYFELSDHELRAHELDEIIKHIVQYEVINVYYGSFENVVRQNPKMLRVSAEIDLTESKKESKASYLFEPELEKILVFFETQMFASLFDQTVREGQLAKYASRVMAMDKAFENIQEGLGKLRLQKLRVAHRRMNKKQLNMLSSVLYLT